MPFFRLSFSVKKFDLFFSGITLPLRVDLQVPAPSAGVPFHVIRSGNPGGVAIPGIPYGRKKVPDTPRRTGTFSICSSSGYLETWKAVSPQDVPQLLVVMPLRSLPVYVSRLLTTVTFTAPPFSLVMTPAWMPAMHTDESVV